MANNWRKEELEEGRDPDKDVMIRVNKLLVWTWEQWIESEKELAKLESQVRKRKD